ncbi:MAG: tyrosine-type recombinase/integrase [Lachnospiraceae bacterium]|nr:tyrosine-type recombinase/integrase [Lachnospiraceae bacterium]
MEQGLILTQGREIAEAQGITRDLEARFIAFLDAKPKTVQTYTRALRQFFNWLNYRGIRRPTFEDVKAYREELAQDHKPTTVQAYIFTVRRFFEWTESEGLYPNVAGKIKGARIDREHKKDYLTSEQVKAVLHGIDRSTLQGKRNYAIVALMITGGLRDIEVSRAKVEDLRTAGNNTVLFLQGKGHDEKTDYVIIPEQTERAIREYLRERGKTNPTDPLFTSLSNNSTGKAMTTRSISEVAKTAMVQAGYDSERLTAHSMRHTAVTLALIANGGNIQEAQQFARHADISTTMIYAHNLERQNNQCSRLIADSVF